jgi:hypothetical protein
MGRGDVGGGTDCQPGVYGRGRGRAAEECLAAPQARSAHSGALLPPPGARPGLASWAPPPPRAPLPS